MDSPRFSGNPALLQHFVFRGLVDLGADDESTAGKLPVRLVVVLEDILGLVERGERLDLGHCGLATVSFQLLDKPFHGLFLSLTGVNITDLLWGSSASRIPKSPRSVGLDHDNVHSSCSSPGFSTCSSALTGRTSTG